MPPLKTEAVLAVVVLGCDREEAGFIIFVDVIKSVVILQILIRLFCNCSYAMLMVACVFLRRKRKATKKKDVSGIVVM
jgi:hypothetical protein